MQQAGRFGARNLEREVESYGDMGSDTVVRPFRIDSSYGADHPCRCANYPIPAQAAFSKSTCESLLCWADQGIRVDPLGTVEENGKCCSSR